MDPDAVNFRFPFEPYDVQRAFMKALYTALSESKVGIFESPTGTGKSLSLLCGALSWLSDHKDSKKASLETELADLREKTSIPVDGRDKDWFEKGMQRVIMTNRLHEVQSQYDAFTRKDKKYDKLKEDAKKRRLQISDSKARRGPEEGDELTRECTSIARLLEEINEESREDIVDDYDSDDDIPEIEDDDDSGPKIIYCSRTHSQLTQFVRELQKTAFSNSIRTVTLASRGNLCINDLVTRLGNLSLINDRCLDMQKASSKSKATAAEPESKRAKTKSVGKCPFYRTQAMELLAVDILTEVQDIEQVVHHARKEKACPYYSSRYATPDAELVLVPYNILLQKTTRDACKLALKDSVVIIDEAHNLLETIADSHSVTLRMSALRDAQRVLGDYYNRYHARMNVKNVMYIKQVLYMLKRFVRFLTGDNRGTLQEDTSTMCSVNDLLIGCELIALNLFRVEHYLERTQLSLKVSSFAKRATVAVQKKPEAGKLSDFLNSMKKNGPKKSVQLEEVPSEQPENSFASGNPMIALHDFIRELAYSDRDGQVLVHRGKDSESSFLKYLLLSPANNFKDVVSEARAIILAGGTMQPTSEFVDQLLIPAGVPPERIVHFSCGHVVAKENLSVIALSQGPTGKVFEFTYKNKMDPEMIDELGSLLVNVTRIIPGGIVCFFPSYEYEQAVSQRWKTTGVLGKLATKKHIFHEPPKSSELEKTLARYSQCAQASSSSGAMTGAILFSVVGGKMSEGINFSDDMGRCVLMVGLPYPNARAPEMKSKMEFLSATYPRSGDGRSAGQLYYESVCMKAVNQSIGRAIRHKDDYAVILLVDQRYQKPSVMKALPAWIQDSLTAPAKFGAAFSAIQRFFKVERSQQH